MSIVQRSFRVITGELPSLGPGWIEQEHLSLFASHQFGAASFGRSRERGAV